MSHSRSHSQSTHPPTTRAIAPAGGLPGSGSATTSTSTSTSASTSTSTPILTPARSSVSSSVGTSGTSMSAPNVARSTKKNASIACEACKVSKRKCDRNQPCSNCQASNKTCIYDPTQDGRRKEGRKRRIDELEIRSQALDKLLVSLRTSSKNESRQLLELIRRDAPLDEILAFLDDNPGEIANETRAALSASPPPEGVGIRRMLAISELTDNPTFNVPASPWTTVTNDDAFVSHLVSVYLNWYHFYYHNFDEKLFLDAMVAKDLDSPYCSAFLVNAVLGMACMFSDHPSVFGTPGDVSSRGMQFYNEAHRLWLLEAARPSLTNIQGFTIMIMTAAFSGKDRVSMTSLKQLEVMVPELLREQQKPAKNQPMSEDMRRSLKIVEWAAHIYSTGFGTGFLIPPTSPQPSLEAPYASEIWRNHQTPWSPYPLLRDPVPLPLQALYHHMCELYLLASDVQSLVFKDFATMNTLEKMEAAQRLDNQMMKWYRSLPARFQIDDPDFISVPTTFDLALTLHHFRLIMWNWTIPPPSPTPTPPTDVEAGASSHEGPPHPVQTNLEEMTAKAKEECMEIASAVTRIIQEVDETYGPNFFSILTPQSGIVAASYLMSGNLTSEREEEMLLQIMRILVQCSRKWQLVRGVTRMLLKTAEDKSAAAEDDGVVPPGGISKSLLEAMTAVVQDLSWEEGRDHLTFSSRYPNHILVRNDAPETSLSDLLEKWADMALNEKDAATADTTTTTTRTGAEDSSDNNDV